MPSMDTSTPEGSLEYLLIILKNAKEFVPDYNAVAVATGMSNANNSQKRFKGIVEKSGDYKLVKGKVIDNDDPDASATTSTTAATTPAAATITDDAAIVTPAPPKKRKSTPASTPASKRSRKGRLTAFPIDDTPKNNADNDDETNLGV